MPPSHAFSMAPLLVHSDAVPAAAREALRLALTGPLEGRRRALETAALSIHRELDVGCSDARELVGLPEGCCA